MADLYTAVNQLTGAGEAPAGKPIADLIFFTVWLDNESATNVQALRDAIKAHSGSFGDCDPFDGKEHNYLELGGWAGDQGAALNLMGIGSLLGFWKLLTPKTMFGDLVTDALAKDLAGSGYVAIRAVKA